MVEIQCRVQSAGCRVQRTCVGEGERGRMGLKNSTEFRVSSVECRQCTGCECGLLFVIPEITCPNV
jgi:hypothetical protein